MEEGTELDKATSVQWTQVVRSALLREGEKLRLV